MHFILADNLFAPIKAGTWLKVDFPARQRPKVYLKIHIEMVKLQQKQCSAMAISPIEYLQAELKRVVDKRKCKNPSKCVP